MTQTLCSFACLIALCLLGTQSAAKTRVLFIGLSGEGAPAIEKSFDRSLRNRITSLSDLETYGFDESQRFRRNLDIERSPTISELQLSTLQNDLPDSVLVVWAEIKRLNIVPVRKNIFRVALQGELSTNLTVYNLSRKSFSYRGTIESSGGKQAGYILFSPISLETVSAADREVLTREMIDNSVKDCTTIIESLCRGEMTEPQKIETVDDTTNYRPPSISDVFSVPSVEPAEISGKKSSSKSTSSGK